MSDHAIYNPSGLEGIILCPGKLRMEKGLPNAPNKHSATGTAAHTVAAECLLSGANVQDYIGRIIEADGFQIEVDEDFTHDLQLYVDAVRTRIEEYKLAGALSVELHVEQQVPIGHITGEAGGWGTADVVIIAVFDQGICMLDVWDLKFGRGVEVEVKGNPQLRMYGAGTLEKFSLEYEFRDVRLNIHQPRLRATPIEDTISVAELNKWIEDTVKPAVFHARQVYEKEKDEAVIHHLRPGEKQCKFCRAKATCPALAKHAIETIANDFVDITQPKAITNAVTGAKDAVKVADEDLLAALFPHLDLIHDWVNAVRARIEAVLLAGGTVAGVKVVQGKKGNRTWASEEQAEQLLKSFRLKQEEMYTFKLITPTTTEKLLKDASPKRWAKVLPLITQSEGKPTVVPESDRRPAIVIKPTIDEFADISGAEELV